MQASMAKEAANNNRVAKGPYSTSPPPSSLFAWSYLAYKSWLLCQRIIFFSHTKPANSTFSHSLSAKQAQTNRALDHSQVVPSHRNDNS